jgi:hypothetical protein
MNPIEQFYAINLTKLSFSHYGSVEIFNNSNIEEINYKICTKVNLETLHA